MDRLRSVDAVDGEGESEGDLESVFMDVTTDDRTPANTEPRDESPSSHPEKETHDRARIDS